MTMRDASRAVPGAAGSALIILTTGVAALSGMQSLFYEGWGQPLAQTAPYLVPAAVLMAAGFVAFRRPLAGGLLLVLIGVASGWWWSRQQLARQVLSAEETRTAALLMVSPILLSGAFFVIEAAVRRYASHKPVSAPSPRWLVRNGRAALMVVIPLAAVLLSAARQLPDALARHGDGLRGARTIRGERVNLVWAPRGPGWNAYLPSGNRPTWTDLHHHGGSTSERCAFLSDDGTAILSQPAGIWRMPTAHETVAALSRGGVNAGCVWDGQSSHAVCRTPPDKETPLWAPDDAPIYYWTRQEATAGRAFAVNYTGGISLLPKSVAGLDVGFRCVKDVKP